VHHHWQRNQAISIGKRISVTFDISITEETPALVPESATAGPNPAPEDSSATQIERD
jgi:hypothetical protein